MVTNARNYTETSVAITTSQTQVLPVNWDRKALILYNTGAVELLFGIGTALIPIAVGSHIAYTSNDAPMDAIVCKVASGSGSLVIWEA